MTPRADLTRSGSARKTKNRVFSPRAWALVVVGAMAAAALTAVGVAYVLGYFG